MQRLGGYTCKSAFVSGAYTIAIARLYTDSGTTGTVYLHK